MVPEDNCNDDDITALNVIGGMASCGKQHFKGFLVSIRSKNAMEILLNKLGGGKWNNCQILERRK